ncbi:MAG: septum formation initiator family protein [Flavobacteriales bacterium]|nr:septum formation initiator family protein [Flavobacteriales bacterium]MCW8913775.1 septum formation initiator family protein [Flavobacteriales bacterium]MCW8938870.1 septum formation initiator family protein [Flavobacteriales bacterium]MCW8940600.1 septum formation initiator family protein [Flavobacteriales bacterium]MCW8969326.1 septum formation initiator family protein [Flavobacteriales bacterium]
MWQKIPKWLKNKYALTLVLFLIWLMFFDQNNLITQFSYRTQLKQLKQDQTFYIKEIEQTKKELKELTTHQKALEKFAREKYLMKKDDEEIFVFEEKKED